MSPAHRLALERLPPDATWSEKFLASHPRLVSTLIPLLIVHTMWWSLAIRHDFFSFYPTRYRLFLVS